MTPEKHAALKFYAKPPPDPKTLRLFPSDPEVCRRMEQWMADEMPAYAKEENKRANIIFTGKSTDKMTGPERKQMMDGRRAVILNGIRAARGSATAMGLSGLLNIPHASVHRTITDLMIAGQIEAINPSSKPIYYREKTPDR